MESPEDVLDRIGAALDDASEIPLLCWSREEIATYLVGLDRQRRRLESLVCTASVQAERAGVPALDGARTLRRFMAGRTKTTGAETGSDLALGRWLDHYPTFAAAYARGQVSKRHVQAFRDLENPRTRRHLHESQDLLTGAAIDCCWDEFEVVCATWLLNADPDGELPKHHQRQRRCAVTRRADGSVTGGFRLDTIAGAAVKNALEAEAHRMWLQDAEEGVIRTQPQRLADALVTLVTRGAARPNGTASAPLVHIVIGEEILAESIIRAAAEETGTFPVDADGRLLPDTLGIDPRNPWRRCELVDGTPLHPAQALSMLTVGTLRRLVLGAESEVLDLGGAVRTFPRHRKDALLAAQRGRCGVDHCHAPLTWLQVDHIVPFSRGGPTATRNGQIYCGPDNHAKGTRHGPEHDHRHGRQGHSAEPDTGPDPNHAESRRVHDS